jgi:pentose-5-phosphate-3-epimerase
MLKSRLIFLALGTACIMTSQPLGAGKSVRAKGGNQIEISLTGVIEKTPDVSICMDGGLYQIKHVIVGKDGSSHSVATRIISKQKQVNDFLQRVAGTRQRVVVTGYPTMGAECPYLNVYYAGPASR